MKINKNIHKYLLIGSGVLYSMALFTYLTEYLKSAGMLLLFGTILLAIAVRGINLLKGLSYTVWIFAAVILSMLYPQLFLKVGSFELKALIVPLLQVIMFGMGSQMSLKDFAGVIKMPKGVIAGAVCQFTIMPLVGITVASLFGFPPEIAAGIVLVGASPSGLASNVMSFIAKANLALSITLTAFATLLSPVLTPFLMKTLAGQLIEVDFWNMMLGIFNMVILPIVAGLIFNIFSITKVSKRGKIIQLASYLLIIGLKNFISFNTTENTYLSSFLSNVVLFMLLPVAGAYIFRYFGKGNKDALNKVLSFISMLGIGIIITIITAAGRESLLEVGLLLILACFIHNLVGYSLGYSVARYILRLKERDCRTIALEVGMQNGGLASGLALQMGKVATVGLAPAVFGPLMNITGSSLANWWRNKPVKEVVEKNSGSPNYKALVTLQSD